MIVDEEGGGISPPSPYEEYVNPPPPKPNGSVVPIIACPDLFKMKCDVLDISAA